MRIPSAAVTVSAPGTIGIPLTLPATVRDRLAAVGRLKATVTSILTAADGRTASVTGAITLRAAPSATLRGQWINRRLGPWSRPPTLTARQRSAMRVIHRTDGYMVRVVL